MLEAAASGQNAPAQEDREERGDDGKESHNDMEGSGDDAEENDDVCCEPIKGWILEDGVWRFGPLAEGNNDI